MCTYLTISTPVSGSGLRGDEWFDLRKAVVYFDHPQDAPLEHALCLDVHGAASGERVAVELDATAARRLAETILAVLDDAETSSLTTPGDNRTQSVGMDGATREPVPWTTTPSSSRPL